MASVEKRSSQAVRLGSARPLDVRFVDHHDGFAVERAAYRLHRAGVEQIAGGVVGRAQIHELHLRLPGGEQPLGIQTPGVRAFERHLDHGRALQLRGRSIHSKGRSALDDRIGSGAQIYPRQQIDRLIAAVSREQAARRHVVQRGQPFDQRGGLRLGIAIESGGGCIARRPPRSLVRVQARERGQPRRMRVRFDGEDLRPRQREQRIHGNSRPSAAMRIETAAACPSNPSSCARIRAVSLMPLRPAGVSSCTVMRFWKSSRDRPL